MSDNKKLVVVLSRVYSTGLSVVRSLGVAGYTVDLISSTLKEGGSEVSACSKYVNKHVEVVSKKVKSGSDEALLEAILAYEGVYDYKPVLFPTDDYTASVMDTNRSRLEEIFIMPGIIGGEDGSMTACMDKITQSNIAKKVGLRIPMEWTVDISEKIDIPEDVIYPCFCKPVESITGYKKEMAMCNSKEELKSHLETLRFRFANRKILIQEFLEIDNEIDLSGVCFDQDVIIPGIVKKTDVAQYEKGVTLAGKIVPLEEVGEIKDKIVDMMKEFHYYGMFDMEFNVVGDKIYFNEVNFRSGGPNYAYYMSGVNLPALYVKAAYGEEYTPEETVITEFGKNFIYEKVAWEDHIHGFLTKKELDDRIKNADIRLLYSDEDPEPQKVFIKKIKKTAVRTKLRTVKKGVKSRVAPPLKSAYHVMAKYPQTKKKNQRDANSEKPRVLVSGRNYCSNLCMARSLGMAGYEVEILRIFTVRPKLRSIMKQLKPDAYSKYIKAYHVCVSRRRTSRIIKKLIRLADPDRKMLLIPADDLVANAVDANLEILKEYYHLPNINNTAGEINRLMSKEVQKEAAIKAGLPVVNSCVIRTENGEFEIPDTVKYPCFIKPNISKNSSKSRMRKCDSKEELRNTLIEFSEKKDIEMLVEDYVEIGKEYSLLGVCTKDGVVGPGFFRAEVGGHDERRGVALIGKILSCSKYQDLIDDLIRFLESLNYEGLYDIDLIETVDGKMYFVEVNMRFGASGYAVTECGVNLPGMYADYVFFNKPVDKNCKVDKPGKLFISERVMLGEYISGYLSWKDMKKYMKETDIHFIHNEDDTAAYNHFKKFYKVAFFSKLIHAFKASKED